MKAYFITYQWKRTGDSNLNWEMDNILTEEFPIRWLINRRTKYRRITYVLMSFQELELTEAEYKEYAEKL